MAILTKSVNNALVYYDDRYPNRWIDAQGANVIKFDWPVGQAQDHTTADPAFAVTSETGSTTSAIAAVTAGDRLLVTTSASQNQGANVQVRGSAFALAAGKPMYFGARFALENGAKGNYLIGMCGVDTTLLNATTSALDVAASGVYFYQLNAETAFTAVNQKAATLTSIPSGVVTGSATKRDFEFFFDGATLTFYADGNEIGSMTEGWATAVLTPSFNVHAGDDGAEKLNLEWMRAIQVL